MKNELGIAADDLSLRERSYPLTYLRLLVLRVELVTRLVIVSCETLLITGFHHSGSPRNRSNATTGVIDYSELLTALAVATGLMALRSRAIWNRHDLIELTRPTMLYDTPAWT
uniref:Uncharacterized protein n=1 Tax=Plectus sambesii TaxID=2011161 RepID=A0A914WEA9_9BILA